MFIIVFALLGFVGMLLWNALIPDLFHGPTLTYLQAVGLIVLSRIFFGFKGSRRHWWKPWRWGWKNKNWKDISWKTEWDCGPWSGSQCGPSSGDWHKWGHMTPEERQKAKEEWKRGKEEWKSGFKARFGNTDKPPEA